MIKCKPNNLPEMYFRLPQLQTIVWSFSRLTKVIMLWCTQMILPNQSSSPRWYTCGNRRMVNKCFMLSGTCEYIALYHQTVNTFVYNMYKAEASVTHISIFLFSSQVSFVMCYNTSMVFHWWANEAFIVHKYQNAMKKRHMI